MSGEKKKRCRAAVQTPQEWRPRQCMFAAVGTCQMRADEGFVEAAACGTHLRHGTRNPWLYEPLHQMPFQLGVREYVNG